MKVGQLMMWLALCSVATAYRTPKERQLLYKDTHKMLLGTNSLKKGRMLSSKQPRNLGMFGPGDDEIVKIKAKKDMLKKKIDMDNGRRAPRRKGLIRRRYQ